MPVSDNSEIFTIGVEGGSTTFYREPGAEFGYVYFYSVSNSYEMDIDDSGSAGEEEQTEQPSSSPTRRGPFPTISAALESFSRNGEWVWYTPAKLLMGYRFLLWEVRQNAILRFGHQCPSRVNAVWARKCGVFLANPAMAGPLRRVPQSEVSVVMVGFEGDGAIIRSGSASNGVRYFFSESGGSGGFEGDIPESVPRRRNQTRPTLFLTLKEALDSIIGPDRWLCGTPFDINPNFLDELKAAVTSAIANGSSQSSPNDSAKERWQQVLANP